MSLAIHLDRVGKRYSRKLIFEPVSAHINSGDVVAITGENGSGKSTLLKMIANVLPATKGSIRWSDAEHSIDDDAIQKHIGYVAPYLELYDELTATEHLLFVAKLRGLETSKAISEGILRRVGLQESAISREKRLRAFSSGMKQRVRIAMALSVRPSVLLLDEATSNLDEQGVEFVTSVVREAANGGAIVVLATNEAREINLASKAIHLHAPASA